MNLVDLTVTDFSHTMASDAPAPGGGSASALNGAIGAGLIAMVCSLTRGRKKYAEFEELAAGVQAEAQALEHRFLTIIDTDTEAFNAVSAVFAMPKDTDEQKAARKAAMQEALKLCTKSPFEMMELALQGLKLAEKLPGKFNETSASDLGCAVLNLRSGMQGAWLNVCINVGGIRDEDFVKQYREGGKAILAEALPLADRLYETILGMM